VRRQSGDTIFALGALSFVYFALNLMWQRPEIKATAAPPVIPAPAQAA
jgi:hypothetical protein